MAKLKINQIKRVICSTCDGNGYVRVATLTGDISVDFRKGSEVHQCWDCDSEGEVYETNPDYSLIDDSDSGNSIN